MKITFLLPTCEPDEMFKWLLPSLNNIKGAKDFIQFAIGFQPPYTNEEINTVLDTLNILGFEYRYFYRDYKATRPFIPLLRMRNDCAMLYPDSLVYGLLDDDMSFTDDSIAEVFKLILDTFVQKPNLGIISIKHKHQIVYNNCFSTDLGIFYRGGISYGFKGLMPENLYEFKNIMKLDLSYQNENLLELFGGYQDKFCAIARLLTGNEAVIVWSNSVRHAENRKVRGAIGHRWLAAQELPGSIAQFIIKYINPNFLLSNSMTLFDSEIFRKLTSNYGYEFISTYVGARFENELFDPNRIGFTYKVLNEDVGD